MATEVVWTEPALDELNEIYTYYSEQKSESVAVNVFNAIVDAADRLALFPKMGEVVDLLSGRMKCYRSLIEGNYKIIYYEENNIVNIALIWDCRQNPLRLLDKLK